MFDSATVNRRLVTTAAEALQFITAAQTEEAVGLDTEGTGLNFPLDRVVGLSLYAPAAKEAIYIPVAHTDEGKPAAYNVAFADILPALNELAQKTVVRMHNGGHDMLFLGRDGMKFYNTADTQILATMMQAQSAGLKQLTLEYRVMPYNEIISYRKLLAEVKSIPEATLAAIKEEDEIHEKYSFATVDVTKFPRAVKYACDDAICCYHLFDLLAAQYAEEIGDADRAREIMQAQFDTDALLAESSAAGYLVNPGKLHQFVQDFTTDVNRMEKDTRDEIRKAMGWLTAETPPSAAVLPSLFDE